MRLQRILFLVALTLGVTLGNAATVPLYLNKGSVTNVPMIDARVFVNEGSFIVSSTLPYETSSTLVFTNKGIMNGNPGFRLETVSLPGVRKPASVVYNDFGATIGGGLSTLGGGGIVIIGGPAAIVAELPQVIINATNIINRGSIRSALGGLVRLTANSIDLTRSDAGMQPDIVSLGMYTPTNFVPEFGILDQYWAINDATAPRPPRLTPGNIATRNPDGTFAVATPQYQVTPMPPPGTIPLRLPSAAAYVVTNAVTPTNWIVQVILAQNIDTNLAVEMQFFRSSTMTNPYNSAVVHISTTETNILDAANFQREIYITDFMASETNFVLLTNTVTLNTYRPSTYNVSRAAPTEPEYASLVTSNAVLTANLLGNPGYTNMNVTNIYAAYGFIVGNIQNPTPPVPGASITNTESRLEITADELNLERTRLRSDGAIIVKTKNLLGAPLTSIDSPNLIMDLAKPSGTLRIDGVIKEFVQRTAGTVNCWSAMWTNLFGELATNSMPDPANPAVMTNVVSTNVIEIGFHVMVVDGRLVRDQAVTVHTFSAKSDEVYINDVMRTTNFFKVDAERLTVGSNSVITLGAAGQSLTRADFPRLRNFTNEGAIVLPGTEILGSDRATPYDNIVNRGVNAAFHFDLSAVNFENSGIFVTDAGLAQLPGFPGLAGTFKLKADTATINNGQILAGEEINIVAKDLKMLDAVIMTPDAVTLSVSRAISDGAEDGNNVIACRGIHLLVKPTAGDFLGTTITSSVPNFFAIPHTWAGEDRGVTPAGYVNNAAVGRLVLKGAIDSLFVFRGVSQRNALYVDFLEFQGSARADVKSALQIDPSLTIYFADSNVKPDTLNGLFNGRLRWVSNYVGLASSVSVPTRGANLSVLMNRGLRESQTVDSDDDGIVNALDAYPLDADSFRVSLKSLTTSGAASTLTLSWTAAAETSYVVEYAGDLASGKWYELSAHANNAKTAQPMAAEVRVTQVEAQRYFRVRVSR